MKKYDDIFLNYLNEYEQTIMKTLCSDKQIVSLLTGVENPKIPNKSLMYKQVFPFNYVPDTSQEAKVLITFYIEVPSAYNSTLKNYYLYIGITTHESLMRTNRGKVTTLLATAVDNLLNGRMDIMGIGTLELVSSTISTPVESYHTRHLTYSVKDWNKVNSIVKR